MFSVCYEGKCFATEQITNIESATTYEILASEARAGDLANLELDLEKVDKFNLEVTAQHTGVGDLRHSVGYIAFGNVGHLICGWIQASNSIAVKTDCEVMLYF